MATPKSNFSYTKVNLEVTFKDLSTGSPTSWLWDFGDGQQSTSKNPLHTYAEEGFYSVTLTPSNVEGAGTPLVLTIGVSSTIESPLDQSIWALVDGMIPQEVASDLSNDKKRSLMNEWQLYLRPLVLVEPPIESGSTHNELSYPPLENQLIAELVAYDLLMDGFWKYINKLNTESSNIASSPTGTGAKKRIETGPTSAEWFEEKVGEELDAIGKAYYNMSRPGGLLEQLRLQICQLAKRVSIYLPMCGPLPNTPIPPSKSKLCTPVYRTWPVSKG